MVHRHHGVDVWTKHPLPFFLSYRFAVVCSGNGLCSPFLLIIRPGVGGRRYGAGEIVKIVFIP